MLNTNVYDNVQEDPYITFGLFLPVILEWMIGSRWNLLQKTSLFMLIFIISYFPWPLYISFPAHLTKL